MGVGAFVVAGEGCGGGDGCGSGSKKKLFIVSVSTNVC